MKTYGGGGGIAPRITNFGMYEAGGQALHFGSFITEE
jgi:hypothetical protein